jgi:membrane protein implicated in regulation of membrane protease activity
MRKQKQGLQFLNSSGSNEWYSRATYLSTFFTIARFGPDSVGILGGLGAAAFLLYYYNLDLLSVAVALCFAVVFAAESSEVIDLGHVSRSTYVGGKCLVVRKISRGERGVVKVMKSDGEFSSELWSAESDSLVEQGTIARVVGIESIILQVVAEKEIEQEMNVPKEILALPV